METKLNLTSSTYTTDDDPSQYLEDPSLFRDDLPQPYRRINKVLDELLDHVWAVINERERIAYKQESRKRPPRFNCTAVVQEIENISALATGFNDDFLYVSTSSGKLVCISTDTLAVVAEYIAEDEAPEITQIVSRQFTADCNLLLAIHSSGLTKLFIHCKDAIFLIASLYEATNEELMKKQVVAGCEVSVGADYIGVILQSVGDQMAAESVPATATTTSASYWIEIFQINKDAWLKELDPILTQLAASVPSSTTATDSQDNVAKKSLAAPKLASPQLVLKIRQPAMPSAITWNSPFQATKGAEAGLPNSSIGTGLFHVISRHHIDLRTAVFESVRQQYSALINCKAVEELVSYGTPTCSKPTIHFLSTPSTPTGLLSASSATKVMVWWAGCSHILHYSLVRTSKDVEVSHTELVWPFACQISGTVLSNGQLLAVALTNNNIVFYDTSSGLVRTVVQVADPSPVASMFFTENPAQRSTCDVSSCELTVLTTSGRIYQLECPGSNAAPEFNVTSVFNQAEFDEETPVQIQPVSGLSNLLLLLRKDGRLCTYDTKKRDFVCEFVPPCMDCDQKVVPISFCACKTGRVLFVAVQSEPDVEPADNDEPNPDNGYRQLCAYKLPYFATLDEYFHTQSDVTTTSNSCISLEDRVNRSLNARTCAEAERLHRLHQRWFELKQHHQSLLQSVQT